VGVWAKKGVENHPAKTPKRLQNIRIQKSSHSDKAQTDKAGNQADSLEKWKDSSARLKGGGET